MRDRGDDLLLGRDPAVLLVKEVHARPTGDESPVLHRSRVKVGCDESIELRKGVRDVEHLLVERHAALGGRERELRLGDVLIGRVHAQGNRLAGQRRHVRVRDVLQHSVRPGDEI